MGHTNEKGITKEKNGMTQKKKIAILMQRYFTVYVFSIFLSDSLLFIPKDKWNVISKVNGYT